VIDPVSLLKQSGCDTSNPMENSGGSDNEIAPVVSHPLVSVIKIE
jgi:hypothetical protein